MTDKKPFMTYEEQIEKLTNKKKIKIQDKDQAIETLKDISYFALVNGYKSILKDNETGKYIDDANFEDVVTLYHFDEKLRILLIEYILIIERKMKSQISYVFSEQFSNEQDAYLNVNNYDYQNKKQRVGINELVMVLSRVLRQKKEEYIKHNSDKYGNVPLWVLINALTFGNVSKMYSFSQQRIQQKICSCFADIKTRDLNNMLSVLSKFRNVCAHNERLYKYKTKDTLTVLKIHAVLKIEQKQGVLKKGGNDLFSIVIIFKYLLDEKNFLEFFQKLKNNIDGLEFMAEADLKEKLLQHMGFPKSWCDIGVEER